MGKSVEVGASPSDLLGSGYFSQWYPGQRDLLLECLSWFYSPSQFLGVSVPTGMGKSLSALLLSKVVGVRTVILTATKGLAQQYLTDCRELGGVEAKGRNNFPCLLDANTTAEDGVCNLGLVCDLRDECPYRVQLEAARKSNLVITNYAYWLAQTNYTDGLGSAGLLICDEAHLAFGALESFLTVYIARSEIQPLGISFPSPGPSQWQGWRLWAESSIDPVSHEAQKLSADVRATRRDRRTLPSALIRAARRATSLVSRLKLLSSLSDEWIVQWTLNGCRFVPKWVAGHSADLFHPDEIPKIVLMSAILSHRTLGYLGVPSDNGSRTWLEAESQFPPENTPIVHVDTARINYRTGAMETRLWVSRIDQIIQRRLDRKGIIFTVSYERAKLLMSKSRFSDIMITHGTNDVTHAVDTYKNSPPPVVLVSPTVTTGWDFPMQDGQPQYAVISKLPYPRTDDPVARARHEDDKEWSSYIAMETLVQSSGRLSRSVEDKAEIVIIDDNWKWFWRRHGAFAPAWFRARYRGSLATVPDPLV